MSRFVRVLVLMCLVVSVLPAQVAIAQNNQPVYSDDDPFVDWELGDQVTIRSYGRCDPTRSDPLCDQKTPASGSAKITIAKSAVVGAWYFGGYIHLQQKTWLGIVVKDGWYIPSAFCKKGETCESIPFMPPTPIYTPVETPRAWNPTRIPTSTPMIIEGCYVSGGMTLIREGQSLSDVSVLCGVPQERLIEWNGISNPDYIQAGMWLWVMDPTP